ncbi:hypothetical protein BJV82DRAFT_606911 [Fennellomyces sp. T-0311]|nr:hypothetical protein BJV82DRAFT_606911 [Fennellomyces sp. T-0311]
MHADRRNNNQSRRRRTTSLLQSTSSSSSNSSSTPLTRATRSSTASDVKKISIQAIHERMARLSMDNHLPTSKLPRLQSSKSQQTRLDPLQVQTRATKSETTVRRSRLRSSTATTAMMAEQDTRRFVLKNNANIHSIWLSNPVEEKDDDDDQSLVEAAQSRLRSLTLARERQLDLVYEIKRTFGDILDDKEDDGNQLIRQLKLHIDQQALQIQDLERALTRERAKHTKGKQAFRLFR